MPSNAKQADSEKNRSSAASDRCFLAKSRPDIRPLSEAELQRLESALGKPVDRQYLTHWVSEATRDVARLSILPTPQQLNIDLRRMARDGRRWLREASEYSTIFNAAQRGALDRLVEAANPFFDSIDALAAQAAAATKAGRPRTPFGLTAFLDRMIGIAKQAKVLPSTPMRAIPTKKAPPPFFQFVLEALAISRVVIRTSPLPPHQKTAALSILQIKSNEALIKILEALRGRVSDYEVTPHGLIERQTRRAAPPPRRQTSPK
jgi:hypothetical protein